MVAQSSSKYYSVGRELASLKAAPRTFPRSRGISMKVVVPAAYCAGKGYAVASSLLSWSVITMNSFALLTLAVLGSRRRAPRMICFTAPKR